MNTTQLEENKKIAAVVLDIMNEGYAMAESITAKDDEKPENEYCKPENYKASPLSVFSLPRIALGVSPTNEEDEYQEVLLMGADNSQADIDNMPVGDMRLEFESEYDGCESAKEREDWVRWFKCKLAERGYTMTEVDWDSMWQYFAIADAPISDNRK